MDAVTLALASKVNNKIIQEKVIDNFDAIAADEIIAVNNEIEKLNNALEDEKDVLSTELADNYNANLAILDANVNGAYEDINIGVDDVLESLPNELSTTLAAVGNSLESRAGAIKCESEGESIVIKDGSDDYLKGLKVFGKTLQNGVPSIDNPVDLENIGNKGTVDVVFYGKNLFKSKGKNIVPSVSNGQDINTVQGISSEYIKVDTKKSYVLSFENGTVRYWFGYDKEKNFLGYRSGTNSSEQLFRWFPDTAYIRIRIDGPDVTNPQVEVGTTPTTFEPFKEPQTLTLKTPNGLPGVPVASGGNYTDNDGQQWICDEIDLERGVYVQRIAYHTYSGGEDERWGIVGSYTPAVYQENVLSKDVYAVATSVVIGNVICNRLEKTSSSLLYTEKGVNGIAISNAGGVIRVRPDIEADSVESFLKWMSVNPITVVTQLATPIEKPLSPSLIYPFSQVKTNYLTTTITNDESAYIAVKYNADTKIYIQNKIVDLSNLYLNSK